VKIPSISISGPVSISASVSISIICTAAFHSPLAAQTLRPAAGFADNPNRHARPFNHDISSSLTSQDSIPAPTWELGQPANTKPGSTWQKASPLPTNSSPAWQPAPAAEQPSDQPAAQPTPAVQLGDQPGEQPKPSAQTSLAPWIVGLGGGVRIGIGEPTFGMVYGRVGREIGKDTAISLRPAYVLATSTQMAPQTTKALSRCP